MPRIYYFATINDQQPLLEFFKNERGLFIQPMVRGVKNFNEQGLLTGKFEACNVGRIPYAELEFTPRDDQLDLESQRKWGHGKSISPLSYPVLRWGWSKRMGNYILAKTLEWDVPDNIENQFLPYLMDQMTAKERKRYRELVEKYYPMCQDMKKEFSAAQRWIRKHWDNEHKGGTWWYGPEAKALVDSGEVEATSFIPGETEFEVVYYSDDNPQTKSVTTKSWKLFDFLTRGKKRPNN